ncbi:NB-ARC domain-containing protein [Oscillatoria salina]|uniref:NB-ARC domain-containing protein n=1 Tax=Oscillatoria salina TaxID=331517 RepID=UPI001CCADFE8|nr:ATP-binding protein [Oscillatoria salina]
MNLEQMLKLADEIVFTKTGQHLSTLQDAVVRGTIQRKTFKQIATDFDCSESHVRQIGSQLWEIFSEELGEEVNKSNFLSAIKRSQISNLLNFAQNVSGSFNICGEGRHPPETNNTDSSNKETSPVKHAPNLFQDLSEMPELGTFYDRVSELETLTTWILQQNCRLIALTGIIGIGKTTLAVKLVQQIKYEFEYVIWCSLELLPTLTKFQAQLIQFISQSEKLDPPINNQQSLSLIKYLQEYRCLVVLDDFQNLLMSGELAGKYKPEHEDYRAFFKRIEKLSHQSCFLLIGWEQPREISQTESTTKPIRSLQITGLSMAAGQEILREYGLAEIEHWETIVNLYQGNPSWLKSVATLLQELGECVSELLTENTLFLPEDVKDSLHQQYTRLSEIEKKVLSLLAKENEPMNLARLLENSEMLSSDLLNALQSLLRRCWLEQEGNFYTLSPVLKAFSREIYI